MLDTFPTCKFSFANREMLLAQNVISGGVSIDGSEDIIATDGGGRWTADYGNAPLNRRDKVMAWRAFRAIAEGGAVPFIFPVCDARHQPVVRRGGVPHSDGTPFEDDSLYDAGSSVAVLASAALRATSMRIDISQLEAPLIGGERFSIDHPTWRHRLYEVKRVYGDTIEFRPPLREAVAAGETADFRDPKCVMHVTSDMSAPLEGPRAATGSIQLVEDMTGVYIDG